MWIDPQVLCPFCPSRWVHSGVDGDVRQATIYGELAFIHARRLGFVCWSLSSFFHLLPSSPSLQLSPWAKFSLLRCAFAWVPCAFLIYSYSAPSPCCGVFVSETPSGRLTRASGFCLLSARSSRSSRYNTTAAREFTTALDLSCFSRRSVALSIFANTPPHTRCNI